MARTPLARDVQRIARAAYDPGSSQENAVHSRRRFLQGAVTAGITTAFAGILGTVDGVARGARIAIVGGGLAGTTCAYRLRQNGHDAVLFEAAERLGGRCWTLRDAFEEGQIAEHGGEVIDSSHVDILQLAKELGIATEDVLLASPRGTEDIYYFDKARYTRAHATSDFKAIWPQLHRDVTAAPFPQSYKSHTQRARELDHMSVADWIDRYVPASARGDDAGPGRRSRLGKLLDVAYTAENGAPVTDQSSLDMLWLLGYGSPDYFAVYGPSDEAYHLRGGNDQLVSKMARTLDGAAIRLNHELKAIARRQDGTYALAFQHRGSTVFHVCDQLVLALPFSMLRLVDLTQAGFSARKMKAISEQGMGSNSRLQLQFRNRAWYRHRCDGSTFSDTGYQATWEVTRAQRGTGGVLVNFTGGGAATALVGKSPAAAARSFLAQLEEVLPGISARWNGRVSLDAWRGHRWTRGSYSYYRVGQTTAFGGVEAEREGHVHFAGEHTTQEWRGFLQGAVFTGQRAANSVLEALGYYGGGRIKPLTMVR